MRVLSWVPMVLAGCFVVPPPDELAGDGLPQAALEDVDAEEEVLSAYDEAAATYEVPSELLLAIASAETSLQMVDGAEEFEGRPLAYGVMGLRGDVLTLGAELTGTREEVVKVRRRANIRAAAAVLDAWADELDIDRDDLGAWAPVVARWIDSDDPDAQASWVWDEVYKNVQRGFELEDIRIAGVAVKPAFPKPTAERMYVGGGDRSYAVWRPSPNYNARPAGNTGTVQMVVIHSCEGSYSGCWSWLNNSSSGVSAHYVVNADGSEVSQLVRESNRAWHVGATYDCDLNGQRECDVDGSSVNNFAIGIEHAGYASQASWSSGLLAKSAQVTCDVTRTWNIPRDSYHIVSHGRLQPYNRVDPGPNWPWTDYLNRVNSACGSNPAPAPTNPAPAGQRVIDSNNANNQAGTGVTVSANWSSSQSVAGYYGTGYWTATTQAVSDPATFWFDNSATTCYAVEARWTSASNRSRTATFIAFDPANRELGRKSVDMSINGGQWMSLGTWSFPSGRSSVQLSRWTTAGYYVVADAIRLTPATTCAGAGARVDVIVDSNTAANGANTRLDFVGQWTRSSATPGYYGNDYLFYDTAPGQLQEARFWINLSAPKRLRVQGWWTAGMNRSAAVPVNVRSQAGAAIGTTSVNQQTNGGQWNTIGTWDLPAGWSYVSLGTNAAAGKVTIADAIRFVE